MNFSKIKIFNKLFEFRYIFLFFTIIITNDESKKKIKKILIY
jgi:hypothetical protein